MQFSDDRIFNIVIVLLQILCSILLLRKNKSDIDHDELTKLKAKCEERHGK